MPKPRARHLPFRISRASLALGAFPLSLALLSPAASHAQLAIDEISIVAGTTDSGSGLEWFFLVEVAGANLTTGSVDPPTGGPLALVDVSGDGLELEYEDGPFATFGALQAVHPAGDYAFTLEGNEVTLAWDPPEPLGAGGQPTLVIDSPADDSTNVSSMPDVAYTFDCTNCEDLNLEIQDLATGGMAASLGFGELDVVGGAFTNPIPFGSMSSGGGPPTPLPDGLAEAELLIGLASFSNPTFDLPSALPAFDYIEASVVFASSVFTVPEPAARISTLAALGVIALLGGRRVGARAR